MADKGDVYLREVINRWPQVIKGMETKAGQIVRKAALDIEAQAKSRAPVDTGTLRASIQARQVRPMVWEVVVGVEYGVYQEFGTRYQAGKPFMRPAVWAVAPMFRKAMRKVVAVA